MSNPTSEWPKNMGKLIKYLEQYNIKIKDRSVDKEYRVKHKYLRENVHYKEKREQYYSNYEKKERYYRNYEKNAAEVIAKIKTMIDYLDLTHEKIKNDKIGEDEKKLLNHIESESSPLFLAIYEKMTNLRNTYPDSWLEDLDWKELYKFCSDFSEENYNLERIIEEEIHALDINEIESALYDELYDNEVQEFEEFHGLKDFNESNASRSLLDAFNKHIQARINEDLDERCLETVNDRIRNRIEKWINDSQQFYSSVATVSMHMKKIGPRIKESFLEKRGQDEIRKRVDDVTGTLDLLDLELLAVLFLDNCSVYKLGICMGWYEEFLDMKIDGFDNIFNDYVSENYQKIRACSQFLKRHYIDKKNLQETLVDISGVEIKNIASSEFNLPIPL